MIAAETIGIVDAPDVTVRTLVGLFDEHLHVLDGVDFFFLDGNHFAEPTRHYTETAFARGDEDLVVVLDDIAGYSGEMDDVWSTLRSDARVHAHGQVGDVGVLLRGQPATRILAS